MRLFDAACTPKDRGGRARPRRESLLVALLAGLLVLAAGCGGASSGHPDPARTRAPAQATTAPLPSPTSGGTLRYVSPKGSDTDPGSRSAPFRTLAHALDQLGPGDVLVVRGGDYFERINLTVRPASESHPITVTAAPGERPVVHGLVWLKNPTWWRILGVNVTWDPRNSHDEHMVKVTDGDDWVFADAELWDARSYAAIVVSGDPHRFELRNLYVHDTHRSNGVNEDHLIYINSGRGSGRIDGCLLVGSPNGRAIKIGTPDDDSGKVRNIVVDYNTMIDNLGPSNIQLAFHTSNVKIQHNLMVKSAPGEPNITAFHLSGRNNFALSNLGWESAGVVERGVEGLSDDGGNVHQNPGLGSVHGHPYVPAKDVASRYGCTAATLAHGETSWCRILS
jgi:hypothetical protein